MNKWVQETRTLWRFVGNFGSYQIQHGGYNLPSMLNKNKKNWKYIEFGIKCKDLNCRFWKCIM